MEGIVAAHAAERHTADDIKILRQLLAKAHKCVDQGSFQRNAFINLDKQIHMNMAVITGNPIYISVLHSIHDETSIVITTIDFFPWKTVNFAKLSGSMRDIQAVENGQADLARKLARNHVLRFSRYMEMKAAADEK